MPKDVDHVGAAGERPECHRAALASSGLAFCPSAGTAQPRRKGPHSLHVRGTSAVVDRVLAAPNERNKIPKKPPGHPNARAPVTPAAVWLTRLPPSLSAGRLVVSPGRGKLHGSHLDDRLSSSPLRARTLDSESSTCAAEYLSLFFFRRVVCRILLLCLISFSFLNEMPLCKCFDSVLSEQERAKLAGHVVTIPRQLQS